MKKISLRLRLTLITALILAICSGSMSLLYFKAANVSFVEPFDEIVLELGVNEINNTEDSSFEDIWGLKNNPAFVEESEIFLGSEVVVGGPISNNEIIALVDSGTNDFYIMGWFVMLGMIFIGSILVWFISGFTIKPLKELSYEIENTGADDLSKRLNRFSAGDGVEPTSRFV